MKIALLDLNHITRGVHTNTAPLGIGLIARYLQKEVDAGLDIRMFKQADKVSAALKSWLPDILGISQYSWNSELNLHFAKLIKTLNPDCLVIAGGPNLDSAEAGRVKYFQDNPAVDVCVAYDGEIPFAEIAKRMLKGENRAEIIKKPAAGSYSFDRPGEKIIAAAGGFPRLESLDVFGSVYADGFFDEFLDQGYHPFLQTHRGCPFTCAFCHTGDTYYCRMLFQSPEIFKKDMEYLGKRLAGRHDITLYLANTNMSLFKEDFAIAEIIKETQEKYDWPRIINVNSGKDPEKLLKMLSIINFQPALALQTLTPAVLENVKRKNIPLEDYIAFQREVLKKTGETSSTELILALPGETRESFLKTVKEVLNSGVQDICVFTLMNLKGTLLASAAYGERFSYLLRHRIVPRQFSLIDGVKIFDTEEVIVGTNTLSFKDYLDIRGLCFTITAFFSSTELIPLKRLLLEYGVLMSDWIFGVHRRLKEFPDLKARYEEFMLETEKELFSTREELIKFFDRAENFQALRSGRLGDNLLRKYKCLTLSYDYKTMLKLAIAEADRLLGERIGRDKSGAILNDMNSYLKEREVRDIFENSNFNISKRIKLNYDIPKWLSSANEKSRLEDFFAPRAYTVVFDQNVKARAKNIVKANKDLELSLQILYRDGNIRDFWPKWELNG